MVSLEAGCGSTLSTAAECNVLCCDFRVLDSLSHGKVPDRLDSLLAAGTVATSAELFACFGEVLLVRMTGKLPVPARALPHQPNLSLRDPENGAARWLHKLNAHAVEALLSFSWA